MWSSLSADKIFGGVIMKKRLLHSGVLAAICAAVVLTAGCGSSGNSASAPAYESSYDSAGSAKVALYEESAMADEAYDSGSGNASAGTVQDTSRKLITTMNINAETDDLTVTVSKVENKVKELGGYIESSNISNNASYSSKISRSASLTARIPADKLDSFVGLIEGSTNITDKSVNVDDVTLSYVDTESRKNALKTEEKRLLEILENAETVEDLITVESRLADVRYELESIESQLRSYDNRIEYSTVYLYIDEVVTFTPVEKESVSSRMGKGFMKSVDEVVEAIVEFAIWFVSHIPQILLFIIIVGLIIAIVKAVSASSKKKRIKKMQMMQMNPPMQAPVNAMPQAAPVAPAPQAPVQNAPAQNNEPIKNNEPAKNESAQKEPEKPQKDNVDGNK
jgi:hypothetical protein